MFVDSHFDYTSFHLLYQVLQSQINVHLTASTICEVNTVFFSVFKKLLSIFFLILSFRL